MKITVSVYEMHRIAWAKANPDMLSKGQKKHARMVPESFGANPTFLFTNRRSMEDAERDAMAYRDTSKYLVVMVRATRWVPDEAVRALEGALCREHLESEVAK